MTKRDITKAFNELKNYGFTVLTFNSYRAAGRGTIGFVDHLVINKNGYMYFIEVKVGKDRTSSEQKKTWYSFKRGMFL